MAHELDRVAGRVHCTIQVGPVADHFDVALEKPARTYWPSTYRDELADSKQAHTAGPRPDRNIINAEVPLGHDLLKVAIRERVRQLPKKGQKDNHVFKMGSSPESVIRFRPVAATEHSSDRWPQ